MPDDTEPRDADAVVTDETRAEEEREAVEHADPGEGPTAEEAAAADRTKESAEGVEEPYREMTRLGAEVKGEGQIA